jgi:WD40 repeat protein
VTISSNGKYVAASASDGLVRIWELTTGRQIRTVVGREWVAFSPTSEILCTESEGAVYLWEVSSGRELTGPGRVEHLSSALFTEDGRALVLGIIGEPPLLWELKTAKKRVLGQEKLEASGLIVLSPSGKELISINVKGSAAETWISVWDINAGTCVRRIPAPGKRVFEATVDPNGKTLALAAIDSTTRKSSATLYNLGAGRQIGELEGLSDVACIAFSPDGKVLATGGEGAIRFWDVAKRTEVMARVGHTAAVQSLAMSRDGKTVASGSFNEAIVWDIETKKPRLSVSGRFPRTMQAVALTPDGDRLITAGEKLCVVWKVPSGRPEPCPFGNDYNFQTAAASSDGKMVAAGSARRGPKSGMLFNTPGVTSLVLGNLTTGFQSALEICKGASPDMYSVAFSPDSKILASGGTDRDNGVVRLFDLPAGNLRRELSPQGVTVYAVAFLPSYTTLAVGSGTSVRHRDDVKASHANSLILWDFTKGDIRRLSGHKGSVLSVAFSPDGKTLASAGSDQTIRLWSVATGKQMAALPGSAAPVNAVAFFPDGRTLVSASDDATLVLWDLRRIPYP